MAILTFRTQTALVYLRIVFLVAREAFLLGILKGYARVALLALHQSMVPQQRESGHGVVLERGLLPVELVMASLAPPAFLTFMLVVLFVTRNAGRFQLVLVQIPLVASGTFHWRTMLTQQREFGLLVVIEQDFFPVTLDVATLALGTEVTLVHLVVILFVARHTSRLQLVFVQIALVATYALDLFMFTVQRILGLLGVIKQNFLPIALGMAAFALRTEVALVYLVIILLVAGHASHLQLVFVQIALVAAYAFQRRAVFAEQREFGLLLVIEQDFFPIALGMASLALAAEFALVHLVIVLLMARAAQFGRVFVLLVDVTLVALHVIVLAQQLEVSLVVVELGRLPVFFAVALGTVGTQLALVRFVVILFMTGHTSLGRIFVLAVDMTLVALHIEVLAQQLEVSLAVVKVGGLPVFFDVALGTVSAQAAFMLIVFFMANITSRRRLAVFLTFRVATLALHLLVEVTAFQGEISLRVIELGGIQNHDLGIAAFMLGMTFLAWLIILQTAVIAALLANILADFFMTVLAKRGLRPFVELLVTLVAILIFLCVPLDEITGRHHATKRLLCTGEHEA
jgi:hypothetical protein